MTIRRISVLILSWLMAAASYAGPYVPGTAAEPFLPLSRTDSAIVGWATGVHSYAPGPAGDTVFQDPLQALGQAEGKSTTVTNLGNGGSITLSFATAIVNGPGADFAVFENGFLAPGGGLFAELAWVEVSSDALTFARFPAFYRAGASPVSEFGTVDPTDFTGLAGKYEAGFGTRFDLSLFQNVPGLDINDIRYVRVVDIIGNGGALDNTPAFVTVGGQAFPTGCPCPIYDPYAPVLNGANGFDLDGIAVLHAGAPIITVPPITPPPPAAVPVPPALPLLMAALLPLMGMRRRISHFHSTRGASR